MSNRITFENYFQLHSPKGSYNFSNITRSVNRNWIRIHMIAYTKLHRKCTGFVQLYLHNPKLEIQWLFSTPPFKLISYHIKYNKGMTVPSFCWSWICSKYCYNPHMLTSGGHCLQQAHELDLNLKEKLMPLNIFAKLMLLKSYLDICVLVSSYRMCYDM